MPDGSSTQNPAVLSYLAMRRAVGWIALALPIVLIAVWKFLPGHHALPTSISGYYYTPLRNLFEGSLCAIGLFNLCCQGYDARDEAAGILSALFAFGVAFCPTSPSCGYGCPYNCPSASTPCPSPLQTNVGYAHLTFATLLFLTLAYFCLVLFRQTQVQQAMTRKKRQRNLVYAVCGCVILASIGLIVLCRLLNLNQLLFGLAPMFCFETTSLLAFGAAWLVKGETVLRDEGAPRPRMTVREANTPWPAS